MYTLRQVMQGASSSIHQFSPLPGNVYRLEWNARNVAGISRSGISPGQSLSQLEEKNKSKWRLHLQCQKAGIEAEVIRVEWEFGTGFFRPFRLEQEKRNTSEDFHLFRKPSSGMSCTI